VRNAARPSDARKCRRCDGCPARAGGFFAVLDEALAGVHHWHTPGEALVRVALRRQALAPGLHRERRVGNHVVVGAQLLAVLELWRGQRVALLDVRGREVVQDHVHAREAGGGHIHFLPFEGDLLAGLGRHLEQERARAAGGVVGGGGGLGVVGPDADHLGHHAAHLGWRVELLLALATLSREVPHQVLVGVAEDVVVLGAVLREVELGLLSGAQICLPREV
jgi:hypothetical protein